MPETINGIGTWYYGKKNLRKRTGACEFCGNEVELSSYDTRLWVVVFFIPVFPLKKKRILDSCPRCTRHRAMDLGEWEKLKQTSIAEALEKMAASPIDPDAALGLHRAYLFFDQRDEGEKLLAFLLERFPDNANVQFYVGAALQFLGKDAAAASACFRKALDLDPQMPEAKRVVGVELMKEGKLDEGRALLKAQEEPGKEFDPGLLYFMALQYQKAARHPEALELFGIVIKNADAFAQDKNFRKAVKASEDAQGIVQSALPRLKRSMAAWWCAGAASLVALGIFGANFYIAGHRTVHVVTGSAAPLTVQVVGGNAVQVTGPGQTTLTVSEGAHHVVVSGRSGVKEEFDITIVGGFFERFFGKAVHIINAGNSAIVIRETTVYSVSPSGGEGSYQLYYGRPFFELQDIDYPFRAFPKSVELSNRRTREYKSRADVLTANPESLFYELAWNNKHGEAMSLAEWHLKFHPDAEHLLAGYLRMAVLGKQEVRARNYLREACKRRPLEMEWHRAYQRTFLKAAEREALRKEYAALLKADPENSTLLYLNGRIAEGGLRAVELYQRALERDGQNAYAHFALGHHLISRGEWKGGHEHLAKACAIAPAHPEFREALEKTRLALGELAAMEAETRAELAKKPKDFSDTTRLLQLLTLQNKADEAQKIADAYKNKMMSEDRNDEHGLGRATQAYMLYLKRDFAALEKLPPEKEGGLFTAALESYKLEAALALGHLADAETMISKPGKLEAFYALALSIAHAAAGDEAKAKAWRSKTIEKLTASGDDETRIAAVLQKALASIAEITDLGLSAQQTAMLLTALAPATEAKREYYALARTLNVEPGFPFYLLQRVLGK